MNKGLAAHIIATIVYALLVLYIFDGECMTKKERLLVVYISILVNLLVSMGGSMNEWYDEKIN